MKKTSLFCLALGLSAALCACGSAATETTPVPETDSAVAATESNDTTGTESAASETESVITEDAVPTSYLTGLECTEEEREQRPMAVMLNNIKAGTPQAGIGQASVIYEAPMEGADVTRLMPLFENWQNLDTIGYIIDRCFEAGVPVMLNPAPYTDIPKEWVKKVTYLTPNEHEAALMFDGMDRDKILISEAGKVIMTVGKDGVVYGEAGKVVKVAGFTVPVVDTTGAGDTFNGAFAAARCEGMDIQEAIRFANAAAALSVGKIGAQGGMPWRKEVEEMLSCRK